ncbi:MAG: hydantoinase/oxoprolinase N-terminal domain-containing protein [Anaerolineae bacterium]
MSEQEFGLGIDTGGTFTDAAIVDMRTNTVVAAAKSPTTRHDLSEGIINAVKRLPAETLDRVGLVSLSTTLATNAIVEGNGAPTCLVLIGYDQGLISAYNLDRLLPTANVVYIGGGHTTVGQEKEPLDEDALVQVAQRCVGSVSAVAVSGFFSVRNPEHELRAKAILGRLTGLPVTCGHELAMELDSVLRAATCALNASLVPLLRDLMVSVQRALVALGIDAPVMVVRGDGSLMRVEMALERPVETILSGPAASVIGAQALTGLKDMLVVDIGGTTTDLAVVRNGLPQLNDEGARVGRWRTLVRAVQTTSSGLGGDSQVTLNGAKPLQVGPRRVMPLAFLADAYPGVKRDLKRALSSASSHDATDCAFFTISRLPDGFQYSSVEQRILNALSAGPLSLWTLGQRDPWAYVYLSRSNLLERSGVVMRSAFTPTDALHVNGGFVAWDKEAAYLGATILGRLLGLSAEKTARAVLDEVEQSLVRAVVSVLSRGTVALTDCGNDDALLKMALGLTTTDLEVSLRSCLPIAGLGAPAGHFVYPSARRLNAEVHLPAHHDVANAVGAICGSVVAREAVQVIALYRPSGLEGYVLTGHFPTRQFQHREEALAEARLRAAALARRNAQAAGAAEVEVTVSVEEQEGTAGSAFGDKLYLGASVVATAVGRPRFAHETPTPVLEERLW